MRRVAFGASLFLFSASGCLQREAVEQTPNTSNIFVEKVANSTIDEIDLLFVIDNSTSMADKQEILKTAVPQMVRRLVNPNCTNDAGETMPNTGSCPDGFAPEFRPVEDIHIGVISSSLGGHGTTGVCDAVSDRNNNDRSLLMPKVRPVVEAPDPTGLGFLSWTGGDATVVTQLVQDFTQHVDAAGEVGCGFEAPLEAFYRFLVDPSPPLQMVIDPATKKSDIARNADGSLMIDQEVLDQREAFLRPEGLVAVVLLTDENDCSAMDGGSTYDYAEYGHLVLTRPTWLGGMPIASPICETNPNDKCCHSCLVDAPSGCDASVCEGGQLIEPQNDRLNARCFDNQRRFGIDLLYPVQRYVDALKKPTVVDAWTGEEKDNPLLRGAGEQAGRVRDPGLVFFAGIIGVPWQDIATDESLTEPGILRYRTADDLKDEDVTVGDIKVDRWAVILGDPGLPARSPACTERDDPRCGRAPIAPLDPFMIESSIPRPIGAANPITGDLIVGYDSPNPRANAINGHEVNHQAPFGSNDASPSNDDLQYACTFPLAEKKPPCDPKDPKLVCDCTGEPHKNSPLCQNPESNGPAGETQYFGKAYPGTRILQVLRDFGENSIVGSICPKITTGNIEDPNYGYNPAVQALVDRLAIALEGKCLPRELDLEDDGSVPCAVIETISSNFGGLDCEADGRNSVSDKLKGAVTDELRASGRCDGNSKIPCDTFQMCEIEQLLKDGRDQCLTDPGEATQFPNAGYCYIDPAKQDEDGNYVAGGDENGQNPIVDVCPANKRRLLRFVGDNTPAKDTITLVACTADAQSKDEPIPAPPTPDAEEPAAAAP